MPPSPWPRLQHDGKGLGYVLVFEDLSDLLKAQKQTAWREVARRVAHEIKNPLTPIALSAERIRRHLERGSPPDAASLKVLARLRRNHRRRGRNGAHTGGRVLHPGAVSHRAAAPANINAIVESTLAMFNGRLDGIHVQTFLAPDLPKVMADAEAIKRALANLVDNAAEAMQGALVREIQISTSLVASRDAVEITVADTGHGVTQELKERLFLPYFSTKKRGTGLGLAIVSRIIEDHRGSIRVEENKPVGTRFVVELPVAAEVIPAPAHPSACITSSSWTTNPASGNRSRACSKTKATRPRSPTAARPAWTRLRKRSFDVVLLDVWLPGMDGLETLQKIRELENAPEVIMISGHGTIETAVRATKLGAYDFLEKPLSIDKTLILIKHAIDARQMKQENRELKKQLTPRSVIVGESVPMKALRQQIQLMAPTNGRVLIYGESGTGKELVAHAIHAQSLRKNEMFVEVNCAAIPEDLIESELFGHRKGRFRRRPPTRKASFTAPTAARCSWTKSAT